MSAYPAFLVSTEKGCTSVDPEIFFTEGREAEAQSICAACPFQAECAAYGLRNEYGIFGGTTPAQRRAGGYRGQRFAPERLARMEEMRRLRNDEGLTFPEIAARMGVTERQARWAVLGSKTPERAKATTAA